MDAPLCTMNADMRNYVVVYFYIYNTHGFKHLTQYKTAYKDKIMKMVCCL